MRLLQNRLSNSEYASMLNCSEWILKIGNGEMGERDGENSITIPDDLIIKHTENPMEDIVRSTYPDLQMKIIDHSYLQERAILVPNMKFLKNLMIMKYHVYMVKSKHILIQIPNAKLPRILLTKMFCILVNY